MNLKSLELFGFKSFMRKLDIHFSDGITVIVGPNGCGKTNVTDALRWVLGEGNARTLRGNRMEDLIFNGTRDYKPLNVAEVSLTIDNTSGVLPVDYAEVTVTRRVLRNGDPEFLINKVPGRLRDIHDLFMDTGLGSRAYSVIERDMVEMVLADQPEKRRELLEEAAGIMKYKIRERQARRKLDATDEDLHRIEDVLREVERQVRSLKRQVGAARRFQEMRDRQRELEVALAVVEVDSMEREAATLEAGLEENRTERDGAAGKVAAIEAEIETRRVRMAEADRALSGIQRDVDTLTEGARVLESENLVRRERRESLLETSRRLANECSELRTRIESAGERRQELEVDRAARAESLRVLGDRLEESEASLANVESDLESRRRQLTAAREAAEEAARESGGRRAELANLEAHREHLTDRDAVLAEELREIEQSVTGHEGDLRLVGERADTIRRGIGETKEAIADREALRTDLDRRREEARREESRLAADLEAVRSALEMLRGLQESWEGYGQGTRALLSRRDSRLRSLADGVHLNRNDLLRAIDAALESAVQYVAVPTREVAIDVLRSLDEGEGQATVVDVTGFARAGEDALPPVPEDPSVLGRASGFVESDGELAPVLERLLARCVVVETLDDAVRLAARAETHGLRFVSRAGEWAEYPGLVHGGRGAYAGESSILGRADRIQDLEVRSQQQGIALTEVRVLEERLGSERESLSNELDRLHAEHDTARERLAEEDRALERSRAAQAATENRRTSVVEERRVLGERRDEVVRQREAREATVREAEEARERREDECRRREEELVASGEDRERMQQEVHARKLEMERTRADVERLSVELERLEDSRRADEEGIERRTQEIASTDTSVGGLAREIEDGYAVFAARTSELEERRRVRDETARERAAVIDSLREVEEERSRWSKLRDEAGELLHEQEMKLQRLESAYEELVGRLEREFSVNLRAQGAREAHGALADADEETLATARHELDDLRRQLERMGAVNLVALDQYERESKRYEFLKTQKDDLDQAREKLRRTIRKINRKARTLFMETLELVRENFAQTFGTLFPGGQADIRLVGDEDPLHAPIEIFARPRGKRLANISLMSSGERSLTAVAFLFAIYLVKPSPFCILDEVDAPLDDANIGRFLDMLRKVARKTQFVMITHNKKTMEVGDYLYGVTMEEPGISKLVSVELGRAEELSDEGTAAAEDELVLEGTA